MVNPLPLRVAFSPCPNDTYLFHPWMEGKVGGKCPISPVLGDIQQLNRWALERRFPVSKVSMACVGQILDDYILLPTGCALGHGCGPKLIAKGAQALSALAGRRIAIPGQGTTAYLLLQLLCDVPFQPVFCTYDKVVDLLNKQEVDAGLIIHETRFTFLRQGFVEVVDLGTLWQERYDLPLPLGGIVAKRALGLERLQTINGLLAESLDYASRYPEQALPFIRAHSQETDREVVQSHIDLYINDETRSLSAQGRKSIETLFRAARERHLLPPSAHAWLLDSVEYAVHA
jgi:1,4-dihydroxy-6-naphthoate synthase